MNRCLMLLEVSQKQSYIFSSRRLRRNALRSWQIGYVTGSSFFREAAPELYREEEQLVYSGGGHTVLQFPEEETAKAFARRVTEAAMRRYEGMELFVKLRRYDETKAPGENLVALAEALEEKKAHRRVSFHTLDLGLEKPPEEGERDATPEPVEPPEGWVFPSQFDELAGEDSFIAVVHIDGNAMGSRVARIYSRYADSWEECCAGLRRFSTGIQADFEETFRQTAQAVAAFCQTEPGAGPAAQKAASGPRLLPIRPVILAGDDVCFVTAGKLGLECARSFVEHLAAMTNQEDGMPYAACAGVSLVHLKYPFYRAYRLAEELCASAKRYGAALDRERRVSAIDWHIEFGQLRDSLGDLRREYCAEDGSRMELRPLLLSAPAELPLDEAARARSYAALRERIRRLTAAIEAGELARGKLKELRTALGQGQLEAEYFLHSRQMTELPSLLGEQSLFLPGEEARCLCFDAIEAMDHYQLIEEVL